MNNDNPTAMRPAQLALFEGSLGAVAGLALAAVVFFQATGFGTAATDSFLDGLVFGLSSSALILVVVPLVYFAAGWLIGYAHGWLYNGLQRMADHPLNLSEADVPIADMPITTAAEPILEPAAPEPVAARPSRWEPSFGERIPERPKPKSRIIGR